MSVLVDTNVLLRRTQPPMKITPWLTFAVGDFARYGVEVLHPSSLLP